MSAILAAEAEAVPSNLDRRPPGFTHKKRKSDSNIERGDLKRARGSRGGVLGRPRKSEAYAQEPLADPEESPKIEQTSVESKDTMDTLISTSTRRSSRKSAASALESSTPWDPTADVLLSGARHKQNIMNGTSDASNCIATTSNENKTSSYAAGLGENTNGVSSTTPLSKSPLQTPKAQTATPSTKQKKRVSFSSGNKACDVQFFARITTISGTKDILLLEEDLKFEVDLVKRYAAWQKAGNTDASFEVFKNIAHFTR